METPCRDDAAGCKRSQFGPARKLCEPAISSSRALAIARLGDTIKMLIGEFEFSLGEYRYTPINGRVPEWSIRRSNGKVFAGREVEVRNIIGS